MFNPFLETTGIAQVDEISPFHLRRFLSEYAQGRSPKTVKTVFGAVRAWLRWLVAEEILSKSPTDKVKAPKVPETSKKVYTTGELKAIFKYLERAKHSLALRNLALISILADTGTLLVLHQITVKPSELGIIKGSKKRIRLSSSRYFKYASRPDRYKFVLGRRIPIGSRP